MVSMSAFPVVPIATFPLLPVVTAKVMPVTAKVMPIISKVVPVVISKVVTEVISKIVTEIISKVVTEVISKVVSMVISKVVPMVISKVVQVPIPAHRFHHHLPEVALTAFEHNEIAADSPMMMGEHRVRRQRRKEGNRLRQTVTPGVGVFVHLITDHIPEHVANRSADQGRLSIPAANLTDRSAQHDEYRNCQLECTYDECLHGMSSPNKTRE